MRRKSTYGFSLQYFLSSFSLKGGGFTTTSTRFSNRSTKPYVRLRCPQPSLPLAESPRHGSPCLRGAHSRIWFYGVRRARPESCRSAPRISWNRIRSSGRPIRQESRCNSHAGSDPAVQSSVFLTRGGAKQASEHSGRLRGLQRAPALAV